MFSNGSGTVSNRAVFSLCAFALIGWAGLLAGEQPGPKTPEKEPPKPKSSAEYCSELAKVHIKYGKAEEALPLLAKAAEEETEPAKKAEHLRSLGEAQLSMNKAADAAATFEKAIAAAPDEDAKLRLNLWLGGAYRTAGQSQKAEAAFLNVWKHGKDKMLRMDGRRQFMDLLKKEDRMDAAVADYEKRVEANPKDIEALEVLSELYLFGKRDSKKSLAVQEKLAEAKPDDVAVQEQLAHLYMTAKQSDKALEVWKAIFAKKPAEHQMGVADRIVQAFRQAEKKDEGVAWVDKLIEGRPADADMHKRAADLYQMLGAADKARGHLEKVIEMADGERKTDARLRLGDMLRGAKKYDEAEKIVRAVLKDALAATATTDEQKNARDRARNSAKRLLVLIYEEQGKIGELQF